MWSTGWSELDTLVDSLAKNIFACRIVQIFEKNMGNRVWHVCTKLKERADFYYLFESTYAHKCIVCKN